MKCPSCGSDNLPGVSECDDCQEPLAQLDGPKPTRGIQKKILSGTVGELQPKKAITVNYGDQVSDALALMRKNKIGCVLVLENGLLRGMLSERDLLLKAAGKSEPGALPVSEVMHLDPDALDESDPLNIAFHRMAVGGYRHLPVSQPDGSFRILSARDLLRHLCK